MLTAFFQRQTSGEIIFSRQNGSDFAKNIADDFNPLHDVDAKRFTVPGDLLFAVLLHNIGLYQHLELNFLAMVAEDKPLIFPVAANTAIVDGDGKEYVSVVSSGAHKSFDNGVEKLISAYVAYSGMAFPHILVPLMQSINTMINPARPMVMYESMKIDLDTVELISPKLITNQDSTKISSNGKRGEVVLAFDIVDSGKTVGHGEKHMLLSGLRDYDDVEMNAVIENYEQRKREYAA
jgi:hypothetical protein